MSVPWGSANWNADQIAAGRCKESFSDSFDSLSDFGRIKSGFLWAGSWDTSAQPRDSRNCVL
jgi:hypothetical protein